MWTVRWGSHLGELALDRWPEIKIKWKANKRNNYAVWTSASWVSQGMLSLFVSTYPWWKHCVKFSIISSNKIIIKSQVCISFSLLWTKLWYKNIHVYVIHNNSLFLIKMVKMLTWCRFCYINYDQWEKICSIQTSEETIWLNSKISSTSWWKAKWTDFQLMACEYCIRTLFEKCPNSSNSLICHQLPSAKYVCLFWVCLSCEPYDFSWSSFGDTRAYHCNSNCWFLINSHS